MREEFERNGPATDHRSSAAWSGRPPLRLENISKRFGPVQALDRVSLEITRGELHAIVGENGAGKSTLLRILGGVHRPDEGRVLLEGEPVAVFDAGEARRRGLAMVHQELSLAPNLSVAENIFAAPGGRPTRFGMLRWAEMNRRTEELLSLFGARISPSTRVADLPLGLRQVVEIAKALAARPKILILDEPTSALEESEAEHFLQYLRKLKAAALTILYSSHRLAEIFSLADRITVLRDGRLVSTCAAAETSREGVIAQMVGRGMVAQPATPASTPPGGVLQGMPAPPVLAVRGLSRRGLFDDISFDVCAGEILGLAGLVGAGHSESMQALVGFQPCDSVEIEVCGRPAKISSPAAALRAGIIYLPEDRKKDGLFLEQSVAANVIAASLGAYTVHGFLSRLQAGAVAARYARELEIRAHSLEQPVSALSGGNQQKVALAKALAASPRLLIVDEPTRGIDVAGKAEIHEILRRFAVAGGAVILISSELPELLAMSTRLLVYHEGRIVAQLPAAQATEEKVMQYATGHLLLL